MPFGEYPHAVDDKGRVVRPPALRDFVKGGLLLMRGMERRGMESKPHLFAYPAWKHPAQQQAPLLSNPRSRAFVRCFHADAQRPAKHPQWPEHGAAPVPPPSDKASC